MVVILVILYTPTQFGWVHHGITRPRLVLKAAGSQIRSVSPQ